MSHTLPCEKCGHNNTIHYKLTGDVQPGERFIMEKPPQQAAQATYITICDGNLYATRHVTELFNLPNDTKVLANWHGKYRTDVFDLTVGKLKELSNNHPKNNMKYIV